MLFVLDSVLVFSLWYSVDGLYLMVYYACIVLLYRIFSVILDILHDYSFYHVFL